MHPCWIKKQLSDHSIFLGWILNVFLTLSPVSHRSLIWWRVCDALPFLWCVNALLRFSTGTGLLARPLKKMAHLTNEKLLKIMMMKRESQMKTQKVNYFTNLVIRLMFSAYRLFCIIKERQCCLLDKNPHISAHHSVEIQTMLCLRGFELSRSGAVWRCPIHCTSSSWTDWPYRWSALHFYV